MFVKQGVVHFVSAVDSDEIDNHKDYDDDGLYGCERTQDRCFLDKVACCLSEDELSRILQLLILI